MELVGTKKSKNRQRKRCVKNKQRRARRKLEVRGIARRKSVTYDISSMENGEFQTHAINAQSFWENYQSSYQWDQRHKMAWLKSRCYALEHENEILRLKVRSQAENFERWKALHGAADKSRGQAPMHQARVDKEDKEDEDGEKFVFHVDKNMLEFLEQSARHKMELKRAKEAENKAEDTSENTGFLPAEPLSRSIERDHKLLYGEASAKIKAMEAALQATTDRHKDRARPDYWPNIPLHP